MVWNPPKLNAMDFSGLESGSLSMMVCPFHHNGWLNVITGVNLYRPAKVEMNQRMEYMQNRFVGSRSIIRRNVTCVLPGWSAVIMPASFLPSLVLVNNGATSSITDRLVATSWTVIHSLQLQLNVSVRSFED